MWRRRQDSAAILTDSYLGLFGLARSKLTSFVRAYLYPRQRFRVKASGRAAQRSAE